MERFKYFSFIRPSTVSCLFIPKAQLRVGPKLVVFLHSSAESVRLSSDSLSPEFRSFALLHVHADHFINDCAYGNKDFIIFNMSCDFLCIYVTCVTEGNMVE